MATPPSHTASTLSDTPRASLRFGPDGRFELQPGERRLLVDGQSAALGARALDLLIALTAQPDRLLTKGELLDRVWPGLVVEEANLQMQISNLRKLLGGDLIATVPGRGYRFVAAVQTAAAVSADTALRETLRPLAERPRLFGRDADRERLESLLRASFGCVTLVGTSGVGKTSLVREVVADWPGRTVWVDLASLTQGDQVTAALARALGAPLTEGEAATPQLLRALGGQEFLVVLDNAEHLVEACAELVSVLQPLAELRLLVTSQLPLSVARERVQRLEPLALAGADGAGDGDFGDGAVALLIERIVSADQRFVASVNTMPVLRSICVQLDGLPLALEMAAARVPLLGLTGVHDALAQRFAMLTNGHRGAAPRHRTLHQALDWSYRLLGAEEQRLFRALGVFVGGFTLDLAVALVTDDPAARWDVIDRLGTLADRSLVVVGSGDPPRYRLLETMRLYAVEQLGEQPGEAQATWRRLALAMRALFTNYRPDDAVAKAQCEVEIENAREAIAWARGCDLGLAAELAARVAPVTNYTVWRLESERWLRALEPGMTGPAGAALPAEVQAIWWTELARAGSIRRDPGSLVAAKRALSLWDTVGDACRALFAACVCVRSIGEAGPALDRACEELQARFTATPDLGLRERLQVHGALVYAATVREDLDAILSGRLAEMGLAQQMGNEAIAAGAESNVVFVLNAMERFDEAAARGRQLLARVDAGDASAKGNLPWVLQGLLSALVRRGSLDEAQALVPRAWAACLQFGVPVVAPTVSLLAALRGRFETASQLLGHAHAAFAAHGISMDRHDRENLAQAQAISSEALGDLAFGALVERGRRIDDAAALALASGDTSESRPA